MLGSAAKSSVGAGGGACGKSSGVTEPVKVMSTPAFPARGPGSLLVSMMAPFAKVVREGGVGARGAGAGAGGAWIPFTWIPSAALTAGCMPPLSWADEGELPFA